MNELVYPRERTLAIITLVLGFLAWLGLIVGTFGGAFVLLLFGFLFYLVFQSALISHIKGNGVELSESQFPDLYAQFTACCDRLQMKTRPQVFILNGNGGINAFATKFLGAQYVILLSNVIDAMDKHADGIRFYIGHELGHLRMKHLNGLLHLVRWPVQWLPLLGAAYSRARETTCDRHGLACSESPDNAVHALAALSAGAERWKNLDIRIYINQASHSSSFWMSFHELTAGYPWLTKRAARVMDAEAPMPKRNGFAYLLAAFIPYAGRAGGAFGLLILVYIVGILAAVGIPTYHDYKVKAKVNVAVIESQNVRDALGNYYQANKKVPNSLDMLDLPSQLTDGSQLSLDSKNMVLTVGTKQGEIIFIPSINSQGRIIWGCKNGEGLKPTQLPPSCRSIGNQ